MYWTRASWCSSGSPSGSRTPHRLQLQQNCVRADIWKADKAAAFEAARQVQRRWRAQTGGGISVYYHPCEFATTQFWDEVNLPGNNPALVRRGCRYHRPRPSATGPFAGLLDLALGRRSMWMPLNYWAVQGGAGGAVPVKELVAAASAMSRTSPIRSPPVPSLRRRCSLACLKHCPDGSVGSVPEKVEVMSPLGPIAGRGAVSDPSRWRSSGGQRSTGGDPPGDTHGCKRARCSRPRPRCRRRLKAVWAPGRYRSASKARVASRRHG